MAESQVYPCTITPKRIIEIIKSEIPLLQAPVKPIEPVKPIKKDGYREKHHLILAALFLGGLMCFSINNTLAIIVLIAFVIALFFVIDDIKSTDNKWNNYNAKMKEYKTLIEQYKINLNRYNEFKEKENDKNFIKKLKQELFINEILGSRTFNAREISIHGKSEKFFYKFLTEFFPNEIYINFTIKEKKGFLQLGGINFVEDFFKDSKTINQVEEYEESFINFIKSTYNYSINDSVYDSIDDSIDDDTFQNYYTPDYIFMNKKYNLHFDIEIDEPYVSSTKEPIHFIGDLNERTRNSFFLEKKWFVIRFAEEQIIKFPKECCFYIAKRIYDLTGDDKYVKQFDGLKLQELPIIERWNKDNAKNMANNNYRDSYML